MGKSLLFKVKRTVFACLFVAAVTGLGSCGSDSSSDDPTPPQPQKSLKAGPSALKFLADGAARELTVTAENVEWTAVPADSWVHLNVTGGKANAVIQVSLDANESDEILTSSIVISAEGVTPVTIQIEQAAEVLPEPEPGPADTEITLKAVEGYWAGDYWGTAGTLDDVFLVMTDMELAGGKFTYPGYVISLDLNIPAATFETFDIAGNYTPSTALTPTKQYSFNTDEVTYIVTYDAQGQVAAKRFSTGGSVKITRSGTDFTIEAYFTLDDQTTFKAEYSGKIKFFDDTRKYNSTLTGNCTPVLTQAEGSFGQYSNAAITARQCALLLVGDMAQETFDTMQFILNVDPEAQKKGAIEGEYTILPDMDDVAVGDLVPGTALPGYFDKNDDGDLFFAGSWYRKFAQAAGKLQIAGMAPCVAGKVVITRTDKEYTFNYSFTDDNLATPHTISGTYKGAIKFSNLTDPGTDPGPDPGPDPDPDLSDVTAGGNLGQWKPGGRW